MIPLRYGLAGLMVAVGCTIVVRVLALGLRLDAASGLVLGGAMVALGLYRIALLRRAGTGP